MVRINPSAQAGNRTVPVYLRVDADNTPTSGAPGNAATALRQGLFVQGLLTTGQAQVLAVELDAVRTDKPRPYVQAVENGRVVHRPVTPGLRAVVQGQTLVAIEGVPTGTSVVAGRIGPLREGTAVATAPGAATSAAPVAAAPASAASTTTR